MTRPAAIIDNTSSVHYGSVAWIALDRQDRAAGSGRAVGSGH